MIIDKVGLSGHETKAEIIKIRNKGKLKRKNTRIPCSLLAVWKKANLKLFSSSYVTVETFASA